jgi:hypothetical protein
MFDISKTLKYHKYILLHFVRQSLRNFVTKLRTICLEKKLSSKIIKKILVKNKNIYNNYNEWVLKDRWRWLLQNEWYIQHLAEEKIECAFWRPLYKGC